MERNGSHHVKEHEKLGPKMMSEFVCIFVWGHLCLWKDVPDRKLILQSARFQAFQNLMISFVLVIKTNIKPEILHFFRKLYKLIMKSNHWLPLITTDFHYLHYLIVLLMRRCGKNLMFHTWNFEAVFLKTGAWKKLPWNFGSYLYLNCSRNTKDCKMKSSL